MYEETRGIREGDVVKYFEDGALYECDVIASHELRGIFFG